MSILYAPSIIKPSRTLITPDTCVNYKHPLADKIVIYNPCLPPNAWIDCAKPYNNFLVPYSNAYWQFQKYAYGADGVVSNGYYGYVKYQLGDTITSDVATFFNQESYSILWTFAVGATTSLAKVGFGNNAASKILLGIGFDTSSYLLAGAGDGFGTNISVTSSLIPKILQTYTAVATFKKDGYLRLYIDGEEVGTAAAASFKLPPSGRIITMGNIDAGFSSMSPCRHRLAIYWNGRELSAEEVRDITADPYQVLEAPKSLFYFTNSGGGTTPVYSDTTFKFDLSEEIVSDSTIKYDIYNIIYSDNNYKYDINNIIYSDSIYKYDILNIISSDSTIKWDVLQNITSDLTSMWDMSGTVSSDSTLKWDMAGLVYSDIALKYDIYNQLASDLGVKFDILANIFGDIALKFDVNNVTTSDLTVLWDMAGKIESDCTFLYDIETEEQVGFFVKQTRRDKASKYNRRKSNSMRYYVR